MTRRIVVATRCCVLLLTLCATMPAVAQTTESGGDGESILKAAREVIAASQFCALVTLDGDGSPNVRMMDAFPPEGDMVVWMATNTESRKVGELRRNPRVAIYYADPAAPGYVTIRGTARLVDDPEEKAKRWKDGWSAFYEEDRSNYVLIEIRPETIEVVNYRAGIVREASDWKAPSVSFP